MNFVLILVLLAYVLEASADLKAVLQFSRHGHRTPLPFYPNDPYKDPSFWGGLDEGELTNLGERQTFALGQYTRKRYTDFLPTAYSHFVFYAETIDTNRAHMSGQCNIYGIFPATGDQIWLEDLNWQPIPVHPSDSIIFSSTLNPTSCNAYISLRNDLLNSAKYQEIDAKYSSVYKYLTENTGGNTSDLISVASLYYTLEMEEAAGYKLPSWTASVYPEPLFTIGGLAFLSLTDSIELKRLAAGPILNEIVLYLEGMAKNSTYSEKFKLYSSNDIIIASLLNSFDAFDPPFPQKPASSLYIELQLYEGTYFVEVYFKNGDNIKQISVKGCKLSCPLPEFRKLLSDIIIDVPTRNAECNSK